MKALHPSDPITTCQGVPDESSFPTVSVLYQQTFKVQAPPSSGATWSMDVNLIPDAIHLLNWDAFHTEGLSLARGAELNQYLDGVTYSEKFASFMKLKIVRHRLMFYGLTVTQDAPALSNQGTVVACQHAVTPDLFNICSTASPAVIPQASQKSAPGAPYFHPFSSKHMRQYPAATMTSYQRAMSMPNALVGQARDGVYMPLRMTQTSQEWARLSDLAFVAPQNYNGAGDYYGDPDYRVYTSQELPTNPVYTPPYISARSVYITDAGVPYGDLLYKPLNADWGYIGFRDLDKSASLSFTLRVGIEAEVLPGSILSPYQKSSPEYDPQALQAYFHISRQLKDAYPASYNDLSKLWGVIKGAATAALPALGAFGPYGQMAQFAIPAAIGVVDKLSSAYRKTGGKAKPSAATLEATQKATADRLERVAARVQAATAALQPAAQATGAKRSRARRRRPRGQAPPPQGKRGGGSRR